LHSDGAIPTSLPCTSGGEGSRVRLIERVVAPREILRSA